MSLTPVTVASIVAVSTEGALIAKGEPPSIRPIIGGFVLGIFLIGLANFNDKLASYMSVLILLSAALINGPTLFSKLSSTASKTKIVGTAHPKILV